MASPPMVVAMSMTGALYCAIPVGNSAMHTDCLHSLLFCRYGHDSYNSYDYTPPLNSKQYDSGYFGGQNGRHIIHLTSALQEALLNASTITGVKGNNTGTFCRPINGVPTGCDRE